MWDLKSVDSWFMENVIEMYLINCEIIILILEFGIKAKEDYPNSHLTFTQYLNFTWV